MIEKLNNAVFSNRDVIFCDIDSDIGAFFSNDVDLNSINLSNINLGDDNFGDFDPKTINHVRIMASYNRYKQYKAGKLKDT